MAAKRTDKRGETYRVRKMINGISYSTSFDHKPSKKEVDEWISETIMNPIQTTQKMTLERAHREYVKLKENVLSVTTISNYKSIMEKSIPENLRTTRLCDISDIMIQKFINDFSVKHAPKTVKNVYSYISVLMKIYGKRDRITVRLPQAKKVEKKIPEQADIEKIMEKAKGTEVEIPLQLALMGMRKSEICALTASDLEGDTITINKAKVKVRGGEWTIKGTKTTGSERKIQIPHSTAELIREKGYVYEGNPDYILECLHKIQDELGIEHTDLHSMRHYFASYCHNVLKLSDKQIQAMGGWQSDNIMRRIYTHSQNQSEANDIAAKAIGSMW